MGLFKPNDEIKSCGDHRWESLGCCIKRCTRCGTLAHDHAYYGYACLNLGLTDREYYRCGGCGHEAERGYDEEEPYYTDSRITGIFSPTESDY